jgi:hypothetical protein
VSFNLIENFSKTSFKWFFTQVSSDEWLISERTHRLNAVQWHIYSWCHSRISRNEFSLCIWMTHSMTLSRCLKWVLPNHHSNIDSMNRSEWKECFGLNVNFKWCFNDILKSKLCFNYTFNESLNTTFKYTFNESLKDRIEFECDLLMTHWICHWNTLNKLFPGNLWMTEHF